MNQSYYLGANSRAGFASLYAGFPGGAGDFLHIVKGGPGTGKSSFMRRLGRAAEERGWEVHYVLCSGDPASLDGVYLPALHTAWMDGTAPHAAEPKSFGVDADYVNLGRFCRTPFLPEDRERITALTQRYRRHYAEAYRRLAGAEIVEDSRAAVPEPGELLRGLDGSAALLQPPERRFYHAISCLGELRLMGEIEKLCKLIRPVPSRALALLSRELERRRLPAIRCPLPLDATKLEALLLPWAGCAFVADWELRGLDPAIASLRRAKALHDELEAAVRPYMDFAALTAYAEEEARRLQDTRTMDNG